MAETLPARFEAEAGKATRCIGKCVTNHTVWTERRGGDVVLITMSARVELLAGQLPSPWRTGGAISRANG